MSDALALNRILHPTDFSPASGVAFAHALKLALLSRAELTIMHIDPNVANQDFEDFPRIRPTLARWGILPEGSTKEQVRSLGIYVRKIRAIARDPTEAIVQHLTMHPTDLVVLATHQYEGAARWLHQAVAEPVARSTHAMTLFVPSNVDGFVSLQDGTSKLERIVIPVALYPHRQPAINAACALALALNARQVAFQLVHVG
ncbi:MAG: universal stress protein, partial [Nitrospiraceae bacterium]